MLSFGESYSINLLKINQILPSDSPITISIFYQNFSVFLSKSVNNCSSNIKKIYKFINTLLLFKINTKQLSKIYNPISLPSTGTKYLLI